MMMMRGGSVGLGGVTLSAAGLPVHVGDVSVLTPAASLGWLSRCRMNLGP